MAQTAIYKLLARNPARPQEKPQLIQEAVFAQKRPPRTHFVLQYCKNEVGTLLALVIDACLTNPRVRFGRSPDELNIWAPFLFYPSFSPINEARQGIAVAMFKVKAQAASADLVPLPAVSVGAK
jgi:hypothetical protein